MPTVPISTSTEFSHQIISSEVDFDIPAFVPVVNNTASNINITPSFYDLDNNNRVGISDLAIFASFFGQDVNESADPLINAADYNRDGTIGITDLACFAANFGKKPGDLLLHHEATPEPALPAPLPMASMPAADPAGDSLMGQVAAPLDVALVEGLFDSLEKQATTTPSLPVETDMESIAKKYILDGNHGIAPPEADLFFTQVEKEDNDPLLSEEMLLDPIDEELVESLLSN